jgi:hypothetical protein
MSHTHKHLYGWSKLEWREPENTSDDFTKGDLTDDLLWNAVDLSSIVPDGTVGIILSMAGKDNVAGSYILARKLGQTDTHQSARLYIGVANQSFSTVGIIGINEDFKMEIITSPKPTDWVNIYLNVLGYWRK